MLASPCPLELPLNHYRIDFSHEASRPAPRFAGNAWRGALGHALRRAACLTGADDCKACPLLHRCAYAYLFDTPVPPDASKLRRYTEAPHPYVLLEERTTSGQIHLHLILFGHANRHLDLMLNALIRSAASPAGIAGRQLGYLQHHQWDTASGQWQRIDGSHGLSQTSAPNSPPCPAAPDADFVIELQTPLRVRREGQHVGAQNFSFGDLFGNVLRRISLLKTFHTDSELEADFRGLTQAARSVPLLDKQLRWVELERHSSRQNADMSLGGLVGEIRLSATDLAPFWPYLWLGQYTHAGRATTMGLGRYRIISLADTASFPPLP